MTSGGNGRHSDNRSAVTFWRVPQLDDLELLHGSYTGQEFPRHMHEEYILGVIVRGAEVLDYRGCTHVAPTGSVLMINPGEWHANYAPDGVGFAYRTLYPSVGLMERFAAEITGKERYTPGLTQPVVEDERLRGLLLGLHLTIEQKGSFLEQESRFVDMMAYLLAHYGAALPTQSALRCERSYVRQIHEYLEAHYATNISLTELGTLTGVSTFHLLRMFHEAIGLPPHEYQTHIRITQAKRLLRQGCAAGQAAVAVGFVDQSHLTRHFKRIVGLTPGQFSLGRKNVQDVALLPRL